MDDSGYMELALGLAEKGRGRTSPNPMVGSVIVKDGRIIGQGYHMKYGGPHAERNALASCTEDPAGATMYVTLEPCCHFGKQPPCTDAIIASGIGRVVTGSGDPNPLVCGKGIRILREHGIAVTEGVLKESCDRLNEVFMYYIRTRLPYTVMKYAMTMDGKIAAFTGASKWITGEAARKHVAELRNYYTAIMAGVGTVMADDPLLTCRMEGGRNPIRIICDSSLRTPINSRIVSTAGDVPTIIATCCEDPARRGIYEENGCEVLVTDRDSGGHVDLKQLMAVLGGRGIDSILLEGGGTLNWSAIEAGIVRKVLAYVAPMLIGGSASRSPVEGAGYPSPDQALKLADSTITRLGRDFLIESEVVS